MTNKNDPSIVLSKVEIKVSELNESEKAIYDAGIDEAECRWENKYSNGTLANFVFGYFLGVGIVLLALIFS